MSTFSLFKNSLIFSGLIILLYACAPAKPDDPTPPTPTPNVGESNSVHLTLGNPSKAKKDINAPTNYLIEKDQFVLSYNRDRGLANWVSWHLSPEWRGSADRQDDFRPDTDVPEAWYRVTQNDYRGSGFDRGHICPSADRTRSVSDNSATFVMTNMMPQAPNNNRETWRLLEEYGRNLITQGNEVYIISGVYGQGGTGSNGGTTNTIAGGRVVVPSNTWKVIIILPNGSDDVNRITKDTRIIAVDMPNTQSIEDDWGKYRVSIDDLEQKTNLDFLSKVAVDIQTVIEAKVDIGPTK
ncbi:DNA/RNA non-specific endonuclease [Microscilla marina]|uniref:Endonuclease n=1 Tax=Microscilla marina ATCC 23134 TaxID=313606 RepID=A1ZCP7_MICM2|nr:DNA/RNA non-specific endonuclease [Microscilla marina]EAY32049.1 DNA/RNA non-specific endonuclease [Microscilla marina ATCC 23134]